MALENHMVRAITFRGIIVSWFGKLQKIWNVIWTDQRAKKVVSDSPGLVDFAIGLVNSVLNLPDGQVKYFEEFNLQKKFEINSAHQKIWGLVEMTFGLVNAIFSLDILNSASRILQCWSYYVTINSARHQHPASTRHRKNSKQSGIVAIDSCFALFGARQYGVTTRESSDETYPRTLI